MGLLCPYGKTDTNSRKGVPLGTIMGPLFINLLAHQEMLRYLIKVPMAYSSKAPFPATKLSSMEPTTSMPDREFRKPPIHQFACASRLLSCLPGNQPQCPRGSSAGFNSRPSIHQFTCAPRNASVFDESTHGIFLQSTIPGNQAVSHRANDIDIPWSQLVDACRANW